MTSKAKLAYLIIMIHHVLFFFFTSYWQRRASIFFSEHSPTFWDSVDGFSASELAEHQVQNADGDGQTWRKLSDVSARLNGAVWTFRCSGSVPVQAPTRCEKQVVRLEAEIQGLMNVINEQHRYIQELQRSQSQQLQQIPNMYLGQQNLYKGRFWSNDTFLPAAFVRNTTTFYLPNGLLVQFEGN